MLFIVEYRRGGDKREAMEIEAADRSALFAELNKRGVSAIRVKEGHDKKPRRSNRALSSCQMRLIATGAVSILAALGVCWWRSSGQESKADTSRHSTEPAGSRKEISPDKVAKPYMTQSEAPTVEYGQKKPGSLKTYRDARGILRYEGGARVPNQKASAEPVYVWANKPRIFKHSAEESIAEVLELEIGQPILGDFRYGERFVKSFKEALSEPTEILDTDDDETIAIKKDVAATKEALRERLEAGEDVAAIMNEAMDELRRLGAYRHELETMRDEYMNESGDYSERDFMEFTEAANMMLKEKGLPPLTFPRSLKRGLRTR